MFADDADYAAFQRFLFVIIRRPAIRHPRHEGVADKRALGGEGQGKRGGARVIIILRLTNAQIVLVAVYGKGERDDVPRPWLRKLKEGIRP